MQSIGHPRGAMGFILSLLCTPPILYMFESLQPLSNMGNILGTGLLLLIWGLLFISIQHKAIRKQLRLVLRYQGLPICIECGYDLTSIENNLCPECGENWKSLRFTDTRFPRTQWYPDIPLIRRVQRRIYPELKQISDWNARHDVLWWARQDSWKQKGKFPHIVILCFLAFLGSILVLEPWSTNPISNWSLLLVGATVAACILGCTIDRYIELRHSILQALSMPWLPGCPCCRYDMDDLDTGECPECGYQQSPLRKDLWL